MTYTNLEPRVLAACQLSLDQFDGNDSRWDPSHAALTVREPSAVTTARARETAAQGMPAVALPHLWASEPLAAVSPHIWLLHDAHVYGGQIRRHEGPVHDSGQLVLTARRELIPSSFGVMDGDQSMPIDLVQSHAGERFLAEPVDEPRGLPGTYVLLGNVHIHYGHILLEGLTRLWIRAHLEEIGPVKWIIYEPEIRQVARDLLALAGISDADIVYASAHDVVERLVVPDPGMRTHRWITSAQKTAWDYVRAGVDASSSERRVFLSRSRIASRPCRNEAIIEEIFHDHGFEVVTPELLTVREQVRLPCASG